MNVFRGYTAVALLLACSAGGGILRAEPVPVRYRQGSDHGFLAVLTLEGKRVATGEIVQTVHGDRVDSRAAFHFRDGSVDEETTVFTQREVFRLVSDHHIQRGPTFTHPMDVLVDMGSGEVTSRGEDGTVSKEHMDLPADVSNGLPPNLLLNILASSAETKISYVAFVGKKPRLIHLSMKNAGKVSFHVGGMVRQAVDYVVHIELGGLTGVVAPILGRQPSDDHIWILPGNPPAFVREEGQMYEGGPVWRVEQISPTFAR